MFGIVNLNISSAAVFGLVSKTSNDLKRWNIFLSQPMDCSSYPECESTDLVAHFLRYNLEELESTWIMAIGPSLPGSACFQFVYEEFPCPFSFTISTEVTICSVLWSDPNLIRKILCS